MIKLFDVRWNVTTAGPSPDNNKRTEVYFGGCSKALTDIPCDGCFNTLLWTGDACKKVSPQYLVNSILEKAPNKYISFCGGEPTDQLNDLIEVCRVLKQHGFHILVYTYHDFKKIKDDMKMSALFETIDILIDGTYDKNERIYVENGTDGFYSSIGSGNQHVIDLSYYQKDNHDFRMVAAKYLNKIYLYNEGNYIRCGYKFKGGES